MKTPKILETALRQYQHNDCSGLIAGFDHKETSRIVNIMEKALKAQSRLLIVYRIGGQPPGWVFDAIESAKVLGIEI
jgi:hypothetical protein